MAASDRTTDQDADRSDGIKVVRAMSFRHEPEDCQIEIKPEQGEDFLRFKIGGLSQHVCLMMDGETAEQIKRELEAAISEIEN